MAVVLHGSAYTQVTICAGELTTNEGFERRVVFLRCGTVFSRAVGDQFREVSKALREERAGVVDFEP